MKNKKLLLAPTSNSNKHLRNKIQVKYKTKTEEVNHD